MSWRWTPYVLPLFASAAISAFLAVYAFRNRRVAPGASAFALMMVAATVWSCGNALQLLGGDLWSKLLWAKVQHIGIVTVPVTWLVFALHYAGRDEWVTRRTVGAAAVVPLLALLLVGTTEHHGLFWGGIHLVDRGPFPLMEVVRGPLFWVHTGYAYVLLLLGTGVMLPRLLSAADVYRWQTGSLLVGLAVPWVTNAVFVLGPYNVHLDPTPFAITGSGLAFAWGLFRYRLFVLVPVAREAVIDGMQDGALVLDNEGRIVDLNPAAARILSLTAADAIARPAADVLAAWPEVALRCRERDEARAELSLGEGDLARHFDLRFSPLADRRGRPRGRLVVFRDITERRRAELALGAQKQLSESLLAVARATTERPTLDATLQSTLDVVSALTGAEGASLFLLDEHGRVTRSLGSKAGSPIASDATAIAQVMDKGLAGWVARTREAALIADTRTDPRWLAVPLGPETRAVLSVPIASRGSLVGLLGLVHTKPGYFSEEHLHLIQAAGDQIALALLNAQIFDAQSRMAERQKLLYEVLRSVGEELEPEAVARMAVKAIAERTRWPNLVIALASEDGRQLLFHASSRDPMRIDSLPAGKGVIGRAFATGATQVVPDVAADPDYVSGLGIVRSELAVPIRHRGHALGVLNLESDRSADFGPDDVALGESLADAVALALENARLYRALAEEHQRLVDVEMMRDEMTHALVHDLRNPLTSVAGVLEALALSDTGLSHAQREMLKLARQSGARMAGLIGAILDVSRLESGTMAVERHAVPLGTLIKETLDLQAALAEDKGLSLECDVPHGTPPARADPTLVGRVLQNLVGNAVKFTPKGGSIRVSVALEPSNPPMLRIAVRDTGPGVPAEVRDRLFQKFAAGGAGHGTGLGLAFCRLAVEAQGGHIWIDTSEGTTFVFTLPVAA